MHRKGFLTGRDTALLMFLWKWKVATTAALHARFFAKASMFVAYRRLRSLSRNGFVKSIADTTGERFVWTLTKKGFEAIRSRLPLLKEEGFKSEFIGHDLVTCAFQLGPWLMQEPKGIFLITEQELRRHDASVLPVWLPSIDLHRPDGYTAIETGDATKVFAIEVELSEKRIADYENLAEFYESHNQIFAVLWLVREERLGNKIAKTLRSTATHRLFNHSFISFSEFFNKGWQAPITIGAFLGQTLAGVVANGWSNGCQTFTTPEILNLRKTGFKSVASLPYQLGDFL